MIIEKELTIDEMNEFAAELATYPLKGFFLLQGELGAGKTTFSKAFLAHLGVVGHVASPTYSLVEQYELPHRKILHADLYRLKSARELDGLGLEFTGTELIVVEWGEIYKDYLRPCCALMKIELIDSHPDKRKVTLRIFDKH